ncbi:MAG: hypothetical protein CMO55_08850 [Verrucomicrobiales bacterium]|nr:hypothetical protein [Verrucomicrobiales bacterium]
MNYARIAYFMKISEYFHQVNAQVQTIFQSSSTQIKELGAYHDATATIHELSELIGHQNEPQLLKIVCAQLEASNLCMLYGMYRSAFSALRLSLEFGVAACYFSVNKLEEKEWLDGRSDLIWGVITSTENGAISKRMAKAYFPELEEFIPEFQTKTSKVYRQLSEYVHGNVDTWTTTGLIIEKSQALEEEYDRAFSDTICAILFSLSLRYLRELGRDTWPESPIFIDTFREITPIREFLENTTK